MTGGPRDADRVRQLSVAIVELNEIGQMADRTARLADDYRTALGPLLNELNALIAGTSTGADKQMASLVNTTQHSLFEARWALDAAAQRARRAEVDARATARNVQRASVDGGRR